MVASVVLNEVMTTHKIEIRQYTDLDEKGYRNSISIYQQEVEDLDVRAVIAVVNKLYKPQESNPYEGKFHE